MKKNLVIFLVVFGCLLLAGGGFFLVSKKQKKPQTIEPLPDKKEVLIETPLKERPYVVLIPSRDGHWLTIHVSRIKNASILEYELLYNTASGANQGSINEVSLDGKTTYSKKILLGSESSGHYKYDEGVVKGNLTVRLRGDEGTRKFVTDFHLQKADDALTSIDGNFQLKGRFSNNTYYLTMSTIGLPADIQGKVTGQPYGVFTTGSSMIKGAAALTFKGGEEASFFVWNGETWQKLEKDLVRKLGTFVAVSSQK